MVQDYNNNDSDIKNYYKFSDIESDSWKSSCCDSLTKYFYANESIYCLYTKDLLYCDYFYYILYVNYYETERRISLKKCMLR